MPAGVALAVTNNFYGLGKRRRTPRGVGIAATAVVKCHFGIGAFTNFHSFEIEGFNFDSHPFGAFGRFEIDRARTARGHQ